MNSYVEQGTRQFGKRFYHHLNTLMMMMKSVYTTDVPAFTLFFAISLHNYLCHQVYHRMKHSFLTQ